MGAWGFNVFDDDVALDILDEFGEIEDIIEFMKESFEDALETDYLDYGECFKVIVSAALMDCVINSTEYDILKDEEYGYQEILERIKNLDFTPLENLAVKALEVLMNDSELFELWDENPDSNIWKSNIIGIIKRLS